MAKKRRQIAREVDALLAIPSPIIAAEGQYEGQYLPGTRIPSVVEERRIDDLAAYTSTILGHLRGDDLDRVLDGLVKRRGRGDAAFRKDALEGVHPDDLVEALAKRGLALQRFGIESIKLKR